MGKEKRNLIITVVLLVVFFFLVGKNFLFRKKAASGTTSVGGSQTATAGSVSILNEIKQNQSLWDAQQSRWDQEAWGRDPFFPGGSQTGQFGSVPLSLTGIVWDRKTPIAMVNDKVLKNGDTIEGYTVVEIKPSSIIFSSGENKFELQLFQANQIQTNQTTS